MLDLSGNEPLTPTSRFVCTKHDFLGVGSHACNALSFVLPTLQNPQLQAAFALLQQLWNKNYQVSCQILSCFVRSIRSLTNMPLQGVWPALTSAQWSETTLPLVHAIADRQRQNAVQLVSCAYSSIQPARLAALTGTSPEDALQSKPTHNLQGIPLWYASSTCIQTFLFLVIQAYASICVHAVAQSEGWQLNGDAIVVRQSTSLLVMLKLTSCSGTRPACAGDSKTPRQW